MGNSQARARRTDPATSHEAARAVELDGTASTQREACKREVWRDEGRTSAEIARDSGLDRYAVARRLPELRDADPPQAWAPRKRARKCEVMGRRALTWWRPLPEEGRQETLWPNTP